jgi:hypothetical protein
MTILMSQEIWIKTRALWRKKYQEEGFDKTEACRRADLMAEKAVEEALRPPGPPSRIIYDVSRP